MPGRRASGGGDWRASLHSNCIGSGQDPVALTFSQVYQSADVNYVIWNDQFYQDPQPNVDPPCKWDGQASNSCSAPWGHSKGVLAWDSAGGSAWVGLA